ncbi:hypothetical protein [Sorangium sp. So ce131]|uniref:hypothetical protein n=1 Tax=Sorangium sp. So ce131 TaxID=3133282 RepID=UPI003F6432FF
MSQPRAAGAPRLAAPTRRPERAAALLAALALAGCGSAPPRATPGERRAPAPPAGSPPPDAAPARWIDASGATAVGPRVAGGTIALLGGRRVLVADDGAVRPETAPCPEPLLELAVVPAAAGARLVGRGVHGVYRFDDPLGTPALLARSETEILRIGGGPSAVAVWDASSDLPSFLDVDTGQPRALPGLPALPLRAIAFRDLQQGAGLFEAAGLAVTADGGATWRLVAPAPTGGAQQGDGPAAALRISGLRLRDGELIASSQGATLPAEAREALVQVAEARLAPAPPRSAPGPGAGAPLLRWIHETGRDPLEAAIASGAAAGAGEAIAASHGLLARVDLGSGTLRALDPIGRGSWVSACGVGRAGRAAWVACALGEQASDTLHDPFGVLEVALAGGPPAVAGPPAVLRSGEAELRVSPSGGAMLLAPCDADEEGTACVRQPGGRWITVHPGADIRWRGAGPLADGRIAIVRGLWDSDRAPREDGDPPPRGEGAGERAAGVDGGPHIAVIDARGREQPLIPLGWLRGDGGDIHVVSPIEEGSDRALSFVVAGEGGELTAVVLPPGGDPSRVRLGGAAHAVIHAGHGVAVGERQVLASTDAGRTWAPVETPARVAEAVAHLGDLLDEPGVLAVNEVGLKIDAHLRVGWGPAQPGGAAPPDAAAPPGAGAPPADPAQPAGPLLPQRPEPARPERALACTTQPGPPPAPPGVPPPSTAQEMLEIVTKDAKPASNGERRLSSVSDRRWGMLSTVAALEVHAPAVAAGRAGPTDHAARAPRATWTLRWLDPTELQGRVRSWTGPAPEGVGRDVVLVRFAALGDRILFGVRAAGRDLLIRARPGRGAEVAEVPQELMPEAEVALGEEPDGPIAWLRDTSLVVWSSGGAPRPIASLASRGARSLGQPTRDGVPLLLSFRDLALSRTVPIPPLERGAAGAAGMPAPAKAPAPAPAKAPAPAPAKAPAPAPPAGAAVAAGAAASPAKAPPLLPLDGWDVVPNVRRELTRLPACGARPRGARFLLDRASAPATVDGHAAVARAAVYDVRVSGGDACVAKIAALIEPEARPERPPGAAAGPGPLAFVRADFAARRAEGGARGPGGAARRLACSLPLRP